MASDAASARRKAALPLPLLYTFGAIVLIAAALYGTMRWSDQHSAQELALTPEAKAYVRNLKLDDVTMKATGSYIGQDIIEIEGKIGNAGERALDTVEIYCVFRDAYGQLVLRKRLPIVSPRIGGLKPGETKPFRLPFDDLPASWNQAMPQLVIAGVKFL